MSYVLKSPGTAEVDTSIGTENWSSIDNVKSCDGSFSEAIINDPHHISYYIKVTDFGFSIPSNSVITAITVSVYCKAALSKGVIDDYSVRIVKGNVIGSVNKAMGTWGGTWSTRVYGGNLWGEVWSPADINATDFGFVISVWNNDSIPGEGDDADVDCISIGVTYSQDTGPFPTHFNVSP